MREAVAGDEVAHYRSQGFVVLPDLLDAGEVEAWRRTVGAAADGRTSRMPDPTGSYGAFFQQEHEYYDRVFTQKLNLRHSDPAARALVENPRLGRVAADLAGLDGVRVYLDQALVKEPRANPTAFHVDVPFWSFDSVDALTIWIALDDATLENGCLCYIPQSHHEHRFDNADIGPELGALFEIYPQWQDVDPVFCPVPAGSAVVHNGLTAHGAGANLTPRRRFAMTVAYMPDGSTYNGKQDIMTDKQAGAYRPGDVLADPLLHPLVYSRR